MNKREMIHALIDKLLDIEDSGSKKELHFSYWTKIGFEFHFNEGNGSEDYVRDPVYLYTKDSWDKEAQFGIALKEIDLIRDIPDVDPKVRVTLTEEKARELGLIA